MADLYDYTATIFMYKYINGILPDMFVGYFKVNNSVHNYNTRQQDYLHTPLYKTSLGANFIKCRGVRLWTNALKDFTWKGTFLAFKRQLKIHFLQRYVDFIVK